MAEDFLSQEEIDALLGEEENEENIEVQKESIAPFDFNSIEHIKKGGLPGLDFILTKWIKSFREEIRKKIQSIDMTSITDVYTTKFNDFMLKIPIPASYSIFSMKPLKDNSLLVIDSRLVDTAISVMFGGPPKPLKIEGREFTKLETKIVKQFVTEILTTFEAAWEDIYPLKMELKSIELNPNLARIVSPTEKVIIVQVSIDFGGYEAPFFFCFPQNMFLPIKDLIYSEIPQLGKDLAWEKDLEDKIVQLKVKLWLELCKESYKIRDIISWDIGTDLRFEVSTQDLLKVYVEDKPKFLAKLGKKKGKYAIKIKKLYEKGENNG